MRIIFLALAFIGSASAQIVTRGLTPDAEMVVTLAPGTVTTMLFPAKVSGTFGGALVSIDPVKPGDVVDGSISVQHPPGSQIVLLEPSPSAHGTRMTVYVGQKLYLFNLRIGSNPDVAVTLNDQGADQSRELTAEQVKEMRVQYDPEIMHDLLARARNAGVMKSIYPSLYAGYTMRQSAYTSDSGVVKTTVSEIHRFNNQDAIVLRGTIQNETPGSIQYDGRAASVLVNNEIHAVRMFYSPEPIPATATAPFELVLQGDIHGDRADLSVENSFRLILPPIIGEVWKAPLPKSSSMPLTQLK